MTNLFEMKNIDCNDLKWRKNEIKGIQQLNCGWYVIYSLKYLRKWIVSLTKLTGTQVGFIKRCSCINSKFFSIFWGTLYALNLNSASIRAASRWKTADVFLVWYCKLSYLLSALIFVKINFSKLKICSFAYYGSETYEVQNGQLWEKSKILQMGKMKSTVDEKINGFTIHKMFALIKMPPEWVIALTCWVMMAKTNCTKKSKTKIISTGYFILPLLSTLEKRQKNFISYSSWTDCFSELKFYVCCWTNILS